MKEGGESPTNAAKIEFVVSGQWCPQTQARVRPALGPALQRLQYVRIRCRNVLTKYHPGVSVPVDWEHSTIHAPKQSFCCSKGDPFQGPKLCSCLTLRNELSEETHVLTKQEILLGKGTQENCSAVSGFMVMGLVSGWSLANHSTSESFLVVHASLSQDGCWWEGFWEVHGHAVSPLDLSRTLLVGGGLLVPYSLSRISCHKTTHANGYYGAWPGWAVSISVLPLTISSLTPFRPLGNASTSSAFCTCNTRQVHSSAGQGCVL